MRYWKETVIVTPENLSGHLAHGRMPGTLYIADRRDVASALTRCGCPVLIWLHEGNRGEDFSAWRYACESVGELDDEELERIYRRLVCLPWDILETERLLVRETVEADVDDFYRIYDDAEAACYLDPLCPDRECERARVRDYMDHVYAFYGFGIWTVLLKATNEIIGRAGISYREGCGDPELGFVIERACRRRGYATEVCRAILDYAADTLGFGRILAFVRPENTSSVRVCEHLGMVPDGTGRIRGVEHIRYLYDKKIVKKL